LWEGPCVLSREEIYVIKLLGLKRTGHYDEKTKRLYFY
jgi:hypothetical protein